MKKSTIFWNVLHAIILVVLAIVSIEFFWVVMLFSFLFSIAFMVDGMGEGEWYSNWITIHLNPGILFLVAIALTVVGISLGGGWLYERTIAKFNNYLDGGNSVGDI